MSVVPNPDTLPAMRPRGTPSELEHRRQLAIQRFLEGEKVDEISNFLGVDERSVERWLAAYRSDGPAGIAARSPSGRPSKLTTTQEKILLRWLDDDPTKLGFPTDLWTGKRVAKLIAEEFGVDMNARYLSAWLRRRGFSPQMPERVPRERDQQSIDRWIDVDWTRIKKKRHAPTRT